MVIFLFTSLLIIALFIGVIAASDDREGSMAVFFAFLLVIIAFFTGIHTARVLHCAEYDDYTTKDARITCVAYTPTGEK